MKVKCQKQERLSRKDNRVIPIPEGFVLVSGSTKTGAAMIIQDVKTKSLYRWITNESAIEIINFNLSELSKVADSTQYQAVSKECDILKGRIALARAVFQKIKVPLKSSLTFRMVM